MHTAVTVNLALCIIGTVVGVPFAAGSAISIANMKGRIAGVLLVMAFAIPLVFLCFGLLAWGTFGAVKGGFTLGLIGAPWAYLALFIGMMIASLK